MPPPRCWSFRSCSSGRRPGFGDIAVAGHVRALAFFARPIGSALFGHFGDRIGRKATLVAALLTMGLSTVAIGALPTYASIGVAAPLLLALCRLGQGLGLGGEWGGAVLLATENAPPGRRAWYGMFPQLGAPLGFLCATGVFLLLTALLSDADFFAWGWRIPFLASALLVVVGLYVRLKLTETPAFLEAVENNERVRLPMFVVFREHWRMLVLGMFAALATFVLFYLMTVFALSWATSALGYARKDFLILQMIGVLFFAVSIPISAVVADRRGRRAMLLVASVAIFVFGLAFAPLFALKAGGGALAFLALGLFLMGLTYGPLGTALAELFPTAVRYTGRFARVQSRRHRRRVAGAIHCDLARRQVRTRVRRLLPGAGSDADDRCARPDRAQAYGWRRRIETFFDAD
jgi:MFS family permease